MYLEMSLVLISASAFLGHLFGRKASLPFLILSVPLLLESETTRISSFFFDEYSKLLSVLVISVTILVSITTEERERSAQTLLSISALGIILALSSKDFLSLFVSWEIASVTTYAMVAVGRGREELEAGMKYFLFGVTSSGVMLFGISIIYGENGTLSIINSGFGIGQALFLAGILFKIGAFPFHVWIPDVYQGARSWTTSFLAGASKVMGFGVLVRSSYLMGLNGMDLFFLLSILTMFYGNLAALLQKDIKRLLAYSSIGHAGYLLIPLSVWNPRALTGALMHIVMHSLLKVGAFSTVLIHEKELGRGIKDYKGMDRYSKLSLTIILLGLAGVPLVGGGGFWSKYVLFMGALASGTRGLALALGGILTSAISLYYYARVIREIYSTPGSEEVPGKVLVPLTITVTVLLLGLYPTPLIEICQKVSTTLFP